jgi:hypothetical protein
VISTDHVRVSSVRAAVNITTVEETTIGTRGRGNVVGNPSSAREVAAVNRTFAVVTRPVAAGTRDATKPRSDIGNTAPAAAAVDTDRE